MKAKRILTVAVCLLISLLSMYAGCRKQEPGMHSTYRLVNSTASAVYSDWSFDSSVVGAAYAPVSSPPTTRCEANDDKRYGYRGNWFEYWMNARGTDQLSIYIFDAQVIESTNWDTIRKHRLYLRRYVYSLRQMDSLNWTIHYP